MPELQTRPNPSNDKLRACGTVLTTDAWRGDEFMPEETPVPRLNNAAYDLLQEMRSDVKILLATHNELKGMNIAGELRDLKNRITALEDARNTTRGAASVFGFLNTAMPWLGPVIFAIVIWFGSRHDQAAHIPGVK